MRSPEDLRDALDRAVAPSLSKDAEHQPDIEGDEQRAIIEAVLRTKGVEKAIGSIRRETSLFLDGFLEGVPEFGHLWSKLPYRDTHS